MWERDRNDAPPPYISVSQLRVMYIVDRENGIRMRALTRLLGAVPPSVCHLVDRLHALGFVERRPSGRGGGVAAQSAPRAGRCSGGGRARSRCARSWSVRSPGGCRGGRARLIPHMLRHFCASHLYAQDVDLGRSPVQDGG
ncbi:MarR family winged helix-turn-helix transcriptional regulator [Streptomyces mirabilis]